MCVHKNIIIYFTAILAWILQHVGNIPLRLRITADLSTGHSDFENLLKPCSVDFRSGDLGKPVKYTELNFNGQGTGLR